MSKIGLMDKYVSTEISWEAITAIRGLDFDGGSGGDEKCSDFVEIGTTNFETYLVQDVRETGV